MKYPTLALLCFASTLLGVVNLDCPLLAQGERPLQSALPPFYAGQLPANSSVKPPVVVAQATEPVPSARPIATQIYDGLPRPSAERPKDRVELTREHQAAEEDALLEHIRVLDRLLESSTVQRILNLMAENMELKAQMRIREAEFKMQLEMMEQRLVQARDSERRADEAQRDSLRPRENFLPPAVPGERDRQAQLSELQRRMEQMHKNHQQRSQELLEQNQELRLELSRREKAAREANRDTQAARSKEETKKKREVNND